VEYEFMRIPHFYSNFYVYQYATGISAALALVDKVTSENNPKKYLEFLSSGSKDYSLNLLKQAGVDMTSSLPINVLINQFDHLVKELFN
jgi:oligoendopeptidase F